MEAAPAAQRFEEFFRDMHRLIEEGKIKRLPPKKARSAIYRRAAGRGQDA